MWPWKQERPNEDDYRNLYNEVLTLRAEMKAIRTEWEDVFEKLQRRDDRLRKRQERDRTSEGVQQPLDLKSALRARVAAQRGSNGIS